ncbi:MAG: aminodeoxychorismate lyase [Thiogranum sp.]
MKGMLSWVNGQAEARVDVFERALQYGDGLFETIRIHRSGPEFLQRHIRRLKAGCERLKFPGMDWSLVSHEVEELAARRDNMVLKLILSRRSAGRGYGPLSGQGVTRIVSLQPLPEWPADRTHSGVRVRICNTRLAVQPLLAGIKHLNRLEQVLARAEWNDPVIAEGLMLSDCEGVIEGTMSNVFIVTNRVLITPDLSKCGVAGIMRSVILDLAEGLGIETEIRPISLDDVKAAREIFVCNSLIGVWPVVSIDGLGSFDSGPITRQLQVTLAECDKAGDGYWYAS